MSCRLLGLWYQTIKQWVPFILGSSHSVEYCDEEAGVSLTAASQVTQVTQVKSFCSVEANKKNVFHYLFKKINCRLLYLTDQYTYIRPQISACRSVVHIQILHDSLYWWRQLGPVNLPEPIMSVVVFFFLFLRVKASIRGTCKDFEQDEHSAT